MSDKLKILPLKPLDEEQTGYDPILPSINRNRGCIICCIGSTSCGKTTLINNLLLNRNMWGGKTSAFDEVYIFSPTINLDDSARFLREHFNCFEEYNDDILDRILASQEQYGKKDMPKIMIVIDDSVGMISRNAKIFFFLSRYRHYNANIILSVQHFRSLSTIARANVTDLFIFNVPNIHEIEKMDEEYGGLYQDKFKELYREATRDKYNFLYLKTRKNPPEAFKNFDKKIF